MSTAQYRLIVIRSRSLHGSADRNLKRRAAVERQVAPGTRERKDRNLLDLVSQQRPGRSLPSRERGSKPQCRAALAGKVFNHRRVAPFTGARIETYYIARPSSGSTSLPSRERGSKLICELRLRTGTIAERRVAPFTGARIETLRNPPVCPDDERCVAPFTGVADRNNIAIAALGMRFELFESLPSRERGSKPVIAPRQGDLSIPSKSLPFAGARIETAPIRRPDHAGSAPWLSLTSRVRGSKTNPRRPLWAMHLRSLPSPRSVDRNSERRNGDSISACRSLHGSADRNVDAHAHRAGAPRIGRSPHGSADRNYRPFRPRQDRAPSTSLPSRGARIETAAALSTSAAGHGGSPFHGSVDRNSQHIDGANMDASRRASLPSRERGSKPHINVRHGLYKLRSAPFTGSVDRNNANLVANCAQSTNSYASLPSRERGSKPAWEDLAGKGRTSLPSRERGSKLRCQLHAEPGELSLPSRERGSKRAGDRCGAHAARSLPSRERGSKHPRREQRVRVAGGKSPPSRERGSKRRDGARGRHNRRRSLHGSVDRNIEQLVERIVDAGRRPFTGAWIETGSRAHPHCHKMGVAPFTGAWIETVIAPARDAAAESLPSRGRGSKQ